MLDFVSIEATPNVKKGVVTSTTISPDFLVKKSKDLMIRGKSFYAIWDEENGVWSKNEDDVQRLVDQMTYDYAEKNDVDGRKMMKLMKNFSSNLWTTWQKYCKSLPDNYHELDKKVTFANSKIKKTDYVTKTLSYALEPCPIDAYEELISTLYDLEERQKIEWAIGSIIAGDSKDIQKFIVLYGGPGTGKSTILNLISDLFDGYCAVFESKALASSNNSFALEPFKDNPLVAIQHDGDLSRIEDNTKLNSIVSHEMMTVNEKFKSIYQSRFQSFLFMGTNKPVRITDAKSGIIRRLIDVSPSGRKIPRKRFDELQEKITFELGGIAYHCLEVYQEMGADYYNSYVATSMIGETNDFYNFIEDNYDFFLEDPEEGVGLKMVWLRYKEYCEDAKVQYPYTMRAFKNELKNYYREYYERKDGRYSVYIGFLKDKFRYESANGAASGERKQNERQAEEPVGTEEVSEVNCDWICLKRQPSLLDEVLKDCQAQYSTENGTPISPWDKCSSSLSQIDTSKVHFVRPPLSLIVIDFDLKDENGNKSLALNLESARKWPKTYVETSKSGSGLHLHYYYNGDVTKLSPLYDNNIEVKVYSGKSALRRMVGLCNDLAIATISSGLLLKEKKKMVSDYTIKSERDLRNKIYKGLKREVWPNTRPSMDYIYKVLEDAYNQGLKYDVTDLRSDIQLFAMGSTHQSTYCLRLINKMHFKSEEPSENQDVKDGEVPIVFFDVEIFPNLFIVCWKRKGEGNSVVKMINPSAEEIEKLTKFRLIGYNNRKYDNHILYARMMGYSNYELFKLSQRIIVEQDRDAFFGEAYNLSYTDVYDFLSAQNKMSLKKWEIKLGIHHQEFGYDWNQNVPENLWEEAADYCCNDVIATEKVFEANEQDWIARQILAEWAGMTVNDTTNSLTTRLIVGRDPKPQSKFVYTDLSTIFPGYEYDPKGIDPSRYNKGAKISTGKSIYLGEDPSEGGRAIGYPGIYYNTAVLDVESMHPHSAKALNIFGEYTDNFVKILDARLDIKHKEFDLAKQLLPEKLHKYLEDPKQAKKLAAALKTAINSVYGLTSAKFPNKLRDPRNVDNIVAKYGALFMIQLEKEVTKRGGKVVHIKTDSIKIANATPEMIAFVKEHGKKYGFTFDHEATYSKMCLVNDAVYIAKYDSAERCLARYGYVPGDNAEEDGKWTATGTQFQIPYVFKTLFTKEQVTLEDLYETKSVTTSMYLDMNEQLPDVSELEEVKTVREKNVESLTRRERELLLQYQDKSEEELESEIAKGHDYHFVGKVGAFCPVKEGVGGGILLRLGDDKKYSAVTGSKRKDGTPYRWMELEMVKTLGLEDAIDRSYYNNLAEEAIVEIEKYGDFDTFVKGEPDFMAIPESDDRSEIPFDEYMNSPEIAA